MRIWIDATQPESRVQIFGMTVGEASSPGDCRKLQEGSIPQGRSPAGRNRRRAAADRRPCQVVPPSERDLDRAVARRTRPHLDSGRVRIDATHSLGPGAGLDAGASAARPEGRDGRDGAGVRRRLSGRPAGDRAHGLVDWGQRRLHQRERRRERRGDETGGAASGVFRRREHAARNQPQRGQGRSDQAARFGRHGHTISRSCGAIWRRTSSASETNPAAPESNASSSTRITKAPRTS